MDELDELIARVSSCKNERERKQIVDEYRANEIKREQIHLHKSINISKEDRLNLPRHLATCGRMEECPLCYKCRSFDPSQLECLRCTLYIQKQICKKDVHTPSILNRMIAREVIDLTSKKK